MNPFPWRKKDDEPALDDLPDEMPTSLDPDDANDEAVASNEEEELLDQYVNSESLAGAAIDTESESDSPQHSPTPDLSLEIDQEEEDGSESDEAANDMMALFEDEAEPDEDMAALSRGLEEVDVTQLLELARTVGQSLASRR